jgi:hypothetical protein
VARVEVDDAIRRVRFVSMRYRDGYFDGDEREFAVSATSSRLTPSRIRRSSALACSLIGRRRSTASMQPPVVTKTWFHTRCGSTTTDRADLIEAGLTTDESRDAYRTLRGTRCARRSTRTMDRWPRVRSR